MTILANPLWFTTKHSAFEVEIKLKSDVTLISSALAN
jgi:hypothetical protein